MPKVSIIVPCWGVEKYLDRCVESLVNQTLKDIEIILVDDESPDRVPQMCDEWALNDERIKVIHKKNEGLGMACNSGLEIASGEYVAFCDSDDWVEFNTYEILYRKAKYENLDAVFTSFKYVDMNGFPLSREGISYLDEKLVTKETIQEMMKGMIASEPYKVAERQYQASAKVVLYRRRNISENKLHFVSERLIPSEDLLFNLDFLSSATAVATESKKFYNYRVNPESITHSVNRNAFLLHKKLMLRLEALVEDCKLGKDGLNRVYRLFIAMNRALLMKVINSDIPKCEKIIITNEIINDSIWKEVQKSYPINTMPFLHRLYLTAILKKSTLGVKLLSIISKIR